MRLCIVIVNDRTPGPVLETLASLEGQVDQVTDQVITVDNDSRDDSVRRIDAAIHQRGLGAWCSLVRTPRNAGLAAAFNSGIRAADADFYMLLAAGSLVAPGTISTLLAELRAHPNVGLAGPRLEAPDGSALVSCFRRHTLISEFLAATRMRRVHALLRRFELPLPPGDEPHEADWLSFACVLMRREVIERVGLLDEAYVRYFEDSDYCRAARESGFRIRYFPNARVVQRRLPALEPEHTPRTFYASRARYFRKGYGPLGPWLASTIHQLGRILSLGDGAH